MRRSRQLLSAEPLWIFAVLWPVVLLAPVLPGLPKVWLNGLPWRQEFVLALLLVATFILLRRERKSPPPSSTPINEPWFLLPFILFIVWASISLFWAKSSLNAVHYILTWGAYLACFILMRQVAVRPRLLRASVASLAAVISIIGIALAIEFWSTPPNLYQQGLILRRSTGLGEPFAIVLPLFTVLAVSLRNRRASFVCGLASVLAWLAVLQSLERAPLAGSGAALLLLIAGLSIKKEWRRLRRPKRAWLLLTVLAAATVVQTNLPGGPSAVQRFQELKDNDPSAHARLLVWSIGLQMLREHPVHGTGANNFESAYPWARAHFSANHVASSFIGQQEDLIAQRAHNEYVQIGAELGSIGLAFFFILCAVLISFSVSALRSARNPLALGAVCSLTSFAISSGASSISFRWLSSGLLFFFAAAIVFHFASLKTANKRSLRFNGAVIRGLELGGLVFAGVFTCVMTVLGISSTLRGIALRQPFTRPPVMSASIDAAEYFFRQSLLWNPHDGPTNFDFGSWLYRQKRYREAANYVAIATEHGFNSSTCYAFLAGAQAAAGDKDAAEQTLAHAVSIYPRSVFLRVRHAIALAEMGRRQEANSEYETALMFNAPAARGWRLLMCFGPDEAYAAAKADTSIAAPEELQPESWAYPAMAEHAVRPPAAYPDDTKSTQMN